MEHDPAQDDDLAFANFIVTSRIYDLLVIIARKLDTEATDVVLSKHRDGHIVGALPKYVYEENNE